MDGMSLDHFYSKLMFGNFEHTLNPVLMKENPIYRIELGSDNIDTDQADRSMYICVTGGRGAGEPAGEEQLPPNGVRPLLATTIRPTRPPTIGQNQRPASPFHLYCSVSSVYHDENSLWFKEMRSISIMANICTGGRRDGLHSDSCVQLSHQSVQCGSEWKPV